MPMFNIDATFPRGGQELKGRSLASGAQVEELFDAVFEWMVNPDVQDLASDNTRQLPEDG